MVQNKSFCFIQVWLKEFLSFQTLWVKAINLPSICLWVLILFSDLGRPVNLFIFLPSAIAFFSWSQSPTELPSVVLLSLKNWYAPLKCLCILHCFTCTNPFCCKGLNQLLCRACTLQLKVEDFQKTSIFQHFRIGFSYLLDSFYSFSCCFCLPASP